MKQPAILILNWRCPTNPRSGGAEHVTLEHAKGWVRNKWRVVWLAGGYAGAAPRETIDGVEIYRYGNPFTIYFLAPWIYWIKFKGDFEIVVDQIHGLPFLAPLWALKSKTIAFIHEVAQEIWDEMFKFPLNIIGRCIEKISFYFYRKIPFITVSDSTKQDLINSGIPKNNIHIIENGLSLKPINKAPEKEKIPTFLFVSRLVKMKGIEDTITTFALVKESIPTAQLWIVGGGELEYVHYLKTLTHNLKVEEDVTFFGYIPEKEKLKLYQKSHLLMHTSVREGFGLVIIEANSQGTPAIVYNSPGLRDLVKNNINGYQIEKGDMESMAQKIIHIIENSDQYDKLVVSSIEYAKRFEWSKSIRQSIKLLEKYIIT